MTSVISQDLLGQALTWEQYYALTEQYALTENKPEKYKEPSILRCIASNLKRMDVVLDSMTIDSKLYNLVSTSNVDLTWLLTADPVCEEAAEILPILSTVATCSDRISMRILLGDTHQYIAQIYGVNGRASAPTMTCVHSSTLTKIDTWRLRPQSLQRLIQELEQKNTSQMDIDLTIQKWYANDKAKSLQSELIDRIKIWITSK